MISVERLEELSKLARALRGSEAPWLTSYHERRGKFLLGTVRMLQPAAGELLRANARYDRGSHFFVACVRSSLLLLKVA